MQRVLVSGGASGFGLHIVERLVAMGDDVAVLDIDPAALAGMGSRLGVTTQAVDVRNHEDVTTAVEVCTRSLGGLDAVVISAGVFHMSPFMQQSKVDWDRVIDVNLNGAFHVAQACIPALRESGRGRIVMISSDVSKRGAPYLAAYTASKFGLNGLCESLAAEFAGDGITVNTVCPVGCPTTGMGQQVLDSKVSTSRKSREEIVASAAQSNPVGRNATEEDVTNAVTFFLSQDSGFLTGLALDVDGGAHLGTLPGI